MCMEGRHIDNIEYIVNSQLGREIKIVFADIEPQLDGYSCERISIDWDTDFTKTSLYIMSEELLIGIRGEYPRL